MIMIPITHWDSEEPVAAFPLSQPPGWRFLGKLGQGARAFDHPNGLRALVSVLIEQDERRWLHVSIARADRVPDYRDLTRAKAALIGRHRKAVQVFPSEAEHVNHHPYTLHLWSCLDGDPLPDFSRGNKMI
jgi:hypothetical protein